MDVHPNLCKGCWTRFTNFRTVGGKRVHYKYCEECKAEKRKTHPVFAAFSAFQISSVLKLHGYT